MRREAGATARERLTTLLPHRDIQRGDIIIFKYPVNPSMHYVKRVIGLPGDRLRLVGRQVQVNGRLLDEGYVVYKLGDRDAYRDDFPAVPAAAAHSEVWAPWAEALPRHVRDGWLVVPPGHYFAMGDNRDESADSRYWGFVPRENLVGRPLLILWSLDSTRADFAYNSQWEWAAGFARRILLLPFKARWNRMFLPIT